MQAWFEQLANAVSSQLQGGEGFTLWFSGERSDFVRFNHGQIRQAGQVFQLYLTLQLIQGQKQAAHSFSMQGELGHDREVLLAGLHTLRGLLPQLQDDPHLMLADTRQDSCRIEPSRLPDAAQMAGDIASAAAGTDLVGILAVGPVYYAFANHLGQRNWQETTSFNFDWSLHASGDKAVKRGQAGFEWDAAAFAADLHAAGQQLSLLSRPARTLQPGAYRAYLAPAAVGELLTLFNWEALSAQSIHSKRSALLKLVEGERQFSPLVSLSENTAAGLAPDFQGEGFLKPKRLCLIEHGQFVHALVSPRSAREFGLASNGADGSESANSFEMAAGQLAQQDVLRELDTGLYLNNLWYLNYSDRSHCRITGMTRFACFWVEQGELVAPLNVMRFDDSLYRMLGDQLEALTIEREWLVDPMSYDSRSSSSMRLPGALLSSLQLVL